MDFQQNNQPEVQNNQPGNQISNQNQNSNMNQNTNQEPALGAQPSGNSSYNNVNQNINNKQVNNNPYNHNPYQNQGQNPNQNNGYGYPNNNGYNNNYNNSYNNYNNGYNNNTPYYNRNVYQMPQPEPGHSLFTAAFILGIVALVFCFTFTVYPAYIFGSIAIVLALLSKGRNAKMHSKASVGVICAIAALVLNTCIVTYSVTTIFTNPEVYEEFNETCEEMYGMSFDEMIDEIMEESGSSY